MKIEEVLLNVVQINAPKLLVLVRSFFVCDEQQFLRTSEGGPLHDRVFLTISLIVICSLTYVGIAFLDLGNDSPNLVMYSRWGAWAGVGSVLIALTVYLVVWRYTPYPAFFFFSNLGIIVAIAINVLSGLVMLAGISWSPGYTADIAHMKEHQGHESPMYDFYCGTLIKRADLMSMTSALNADSAILMNYNNYLSKITAAQSANNVEMEKTLEEMKGDLNAARSSGVRPVFKYQWLVAPIRGNALGEQGLLYVRESHDITRRDLDIMKRSIVINNNIAFAPLIIVKGYPILAAFLFIGMIVGFYVWSIALRFIWRVVVKVQLSRWRRAQAGALVTLATFLVFGALGFARSGLLEFWLGPEPTIQRAIAELHYRFRESEALCGKLNSFGLW